MKQIAAVAFQGLSVFLLSFKQLLSTDSIDFQYKMHRKCILLLRNKLLNSKRLRLVSDRAQGQVMNFAEQPHQALRR
jgi:hypothetical protein